MKFRLTIQRCLVTGVLAIMCWNVPRASAQMAIDIEEPPIKYSDTKDDNVVSRLIDRLNSGDLKLDYDRSHGYLKSVLRELNISESSQVLVFSKTSMQVRYISKRNPRAIYFNDNTYVGWVRGSSIMEISTDDPKLGAAFYTVEMKPWKADVQRADYDCLSCHATSMTQGIPGHTVRSVMPNVDGSIDSQLLSYVTDHSSPLEQRWGGWYVTGRHGDAKHMGNAVLRGGKLHTDRSSNLLSLREEFESFDWLTPYSDIVALMVLEHQTQMYNTMVRANFTVRKHRHDQLDDQELTVLIQQAAEPVVDYMLFCDEAALDEPVKGSVVFATEFTSRGLQDDQQRSLRDFDLQTKLFRYPCSYLIHSSSFDALDESLRAEIYRQLADVLTGKNNASKYKHLDEPTRKAIIEILRSKKSDLADDWAKS
ncbi:hypothetical protein [Stieleria marina]|uniref:Cytochrome c domain-containing protein n=1 Tax=Stieleria marina TaxID=1930275 RepID=A0A517P1R7_9BACT|nr:hypothetical protein K239x_53290 [Planctomycetes bacterium K23_9]